MKTYYYLPQVLDFLVMKNDSVYGKIASTEVNCGIRDSKKNI